jgi:hypothetical protein
MDTTTQHSVEASIDWIGQMRTATISAIALAAIVASMVAWAVILDRALSAHP